MSEAELMKKTVAQLKEMCSEQGINIPAGSKKADIVALLVKGGAKEEPKPAPKKEPAKKEPAKKEPAKKEPAKKEPAKKEPAKKEAPKPAPKKASKVKKPKTPKVKKPKTPKVKKPKGPKKPLTERLKDFSKKARGQ